MARSGFTWAIQVLSPWALGLGLMMSFTADAGVDYASGASLAPLEMQVLAAAPDDLVPSLANRAALLSGDLGGFGAAGRIGSARGVLREARLALSPRDEYRPIVDEASPRMELKPNPGRFPRISRLRKGDPVVALRPAFESRLRAPGGLKAFIERDLMFGVDEAGVFSSFASAVEIGGPGLEAPAAFEPWPEGEAPTATPAPGRGPGASPVSPGSSVTYRPAALAQRLLQGATPAAPRAQSLGSSTPVSQDQTPVAVSAEGAPTAVTPDAASHLARATRSSSRDYVSLISPAHMAQEKKCLAEGVYFEARSEPEAGQAAVAQVILNRVASGLYPSSICGVVYQNRHRYKACQFSFACEGKRLRVTEGAAWGLATRVADDVLTGRRWLADVGGATHYHANYVRPRWARFLTKMDVIGKHVFYRLKPGQT